MVRLPVVEHERARREGDRCSCRPSRTLPTWTTGPGSPRAIAATGRGLPLIGGAATSPVRERVTTRPSASAAATRPCPGPVPAVEQPHGATEIGAEDTGAVLGDERDRPADGVRDAVARAVPEHDRRRPARLRRRECEPARRRARRGRGPELVVRDVAADVRHPEDAPPGGRDLRDPEAAAESLLAADDRPRPERPEAAAAGVPEPDRPAVGLRPADGVGDRRCR